jgi:putative protease
MLTRLAPERLEVVLHHHMQMFHTDFCAFAAYLGESVDRCGQPCRRHNLELEDHVGAAHPVLRDAACRNTVFNAAAQSACEFARQMQGSGLRHFRIELLRESADQTKRLLSLYANLLAGNSDGTACWRELRAAGMGALTRGTMTNA